MTPAQRVIAVRMFEQGFGTTLVAARFGVSRGCVRGLHERWQVLGAGALGASTTRRVYPDEFKLEAASRFNAGESAVALATEFSIPSPRLVQSWAQQLRDRGEDALVDKRRARRKPAGPDVGTTGDGVQDTELVAQLAALREDNKFLRAQVAALKKLQALRNQQHD